MNRAWLFFLSLAKGFSYARRNVGRANELLRVFRQRPHHVDNVDDLKLPLLAGLHRFLTRDHHHRHPTEFGVGRRGDKIRRTWSERR